MTQVPLTDEQELEPNENSQKSTYQILCHSLALICSPQTTQMMHSKNNDHQVRFTK